MDEGWGAVVLDAAKHFGWPYVVVGLLVFLAIWKFDLVKRVFVDRERHEREQLSEDTQKLIENLQGDADRQRRWRIEEGGRYEAQISELRGRSDRLADALASSERGNSRIRHALANSLSWGAAIRRKARAAGLQIPPFPLDDLMELDQDLGRKMKEILGED